MAEAVAVGSHWALVAIVPDADGTARWVGRWALYKTFSLAMHAGEPGQGSTKISGTTASFASEAEAQAQAEEDARRTEAVVSGTYRQ